MLLEHILPERLTGPEMVVNLDLSMLLMTGGQERTEAQFRSLLASADFEVQQIIPTKTQRRVIEAVPANFNRTS